MIMLMVIMILLMMMMMMLILIKMIMINDDDDDKDNDDDLRLILLTTCMSLLNLSINYLKTNFTILCLYSSEADEMAMSQLFCILDTFAGFKRQNLYTR